MGNGTGLTFMNPAVSGGAVGITGAEGVTGPGAGPYSCANDKPGKKRESRRVLEYTLIIRWVGGKAR